MTKKLRNFMVRCGPVAGSRKARHRTAGCAAFLVFAVAIAGPSAGAEKTGPSAGAENTGQSAGAEKPAATASPLRTSENQCVACHQVEKLPITLGHSMGDWHGSAHGRGNVGCEKCHGGNSAARDAKSAHEGVLTSTDPKSMVSTANIAATCGTCHTPEYDAYKSTSHAGHISKDESAATCVTCHGAMATSLPSRQELKARCRECHDKPVQAESAISWLLAAKTELILARRAVDEAKPALPDWHAGAVTRFQDMEKVYAKILLDWHKFDMESSIKQSRNVIDLAKLLQQEAHVNMKMKDKK